MVNWSSQYVNDPDRDFDLVLELMHDEEYIGWVQYDIEGATQVRFFGDDVEVPWNWLQGEVARFEREAPRPSKQ